jgi:hypothetical protein
MYTMLLVYDYRGGQLGPAPAISGIEARCKSSSRSLSLPRPQRAAARPERKDAMLAPVKIVMRERSRDHAALYRLQFLESDDSETSLRGGAGQGGRGAGRRGD